MKKLLLLLLSILILPLSVYASSEHTILGTNTIKTSGKYEIITDVKVNTLQIRRVRHVDYKKCSNHNQHRDHLEINGPINPDTPYIVEKLLKKMSNPPDECVDPADGIAWSIDVYLNSGGGYMRDGYKLGEIFRKYQVNTKIAGWGGECYSSCATAFLGGKYRKMGEESKLMFHAPYSYSSIFGSDISCAYSDKELLSYMQKMLNPTDGKFLYERTMSYCSKSAGWFINKDAAELFEILKG